MAYDETITAGTVDKSIEIVMRDSATGQGKTGLTPTDVTASYVREGGGSVLVTLGSQNWGEVDSTNCPGLYRFAIPNEALADGAAAVTLCFTASGTIDKYVRIALIKANLRDPVRAGLTALPYADAGTNGGLPVAGTGANQISLTGGKVAVRSIDSGVITNSVIADGAITASKFANNAINSQNLAETAAGKVANSVWSHNNRNLSQYPPGVIELLNRLSEQRANYLDLIPNLSTSEDIEDLELGFAGVIDMTSRLYNMTEMFGNPAYPRFKNSALEAAPSGGGGGGGVDSPGVITLLARLTATRADYLDHIPSLSNRLTAARAGHLDHIPSLANRLTETRAGHLDRIPSLADRLTEARAGYLDYLETLTTLEGGSRKFKPSAIPNIDKIPTIEADVTSVKNTLASLNARLTADRAGHLDRIPSLADRLTEARAGYLDYLETLTTLEGGSRKFKPSAIPNIDKIPTIEADVTSVKNTLASLNARLTETRAGHLDRIPSLADRLTEARAGYLDYLETLTTLEGGSRKFKPSAIPNIDKIPTIEADVTSVKNTLASLNARLTETRAGHLDRIPSLADRLTEARAGYLDYLETLTTLEGGSRKFKPSAIPNIDKIPTIEADVTSVKNTLASLNARLTETRAGHLDRIPSLADRLTEARAGYLDYLETLTTLEGGSRKFKPSAIPNIDKIPTIEADVTSVKNTLASLNARLTETRAGHLDRIPSLADRLTETRAGHLDLLPSLANRLTETRAGYLDHLNKLNAMIEQSGQDYQFKRSALINSPGGVAVWGGGS